MKLVTSGPRSRLQPGMGMVREAGLGLLAVSLLALSAGRADAQWTIDQPPPFSRSIVDKGLFEDSGNYLAVTNEFDMVAGEQMGTVRPLVALDFIIPSTSSIFFMFFSFKIEDPANPGSFVNAIDLPLSWDIAAGAVESDTFRVEMMLDSPGGNLVSYYDMTLSTAGAAATSCPPGSPVNDHDAVSGIDLPPGTLPLGGAPFTVAAAACAVEEMGVTNELPANILILDISGTLFVPAVPALSDLGLAIVAGLLLGSACWLIQRGPGIVAA